MNNRSRYVFAALLTMLSVCWSLLADAQVSYPAVSGWMVNFNGSTTSPSRAEACAVHDIQDGSATYHVDPPGSNHCGGTYTSGGTGQFAGQSVGEFCHTTGACKVFNGNLYCPDGGTLSGTYCVNAGACPTPGDVRDPTTGRCGSTKPTKNSGRPDSMLCNANPCNAGTGAKFQLEPVVRSGGTALLVEQLAYNSQVASDADAIWVGIFGKGWKGNYERDVIGGTGGAVARRPSGRVIDFQPPPSGNSYVPDADIADRLERLVSGSTTTGWMYYVAEDDSIETYSADGKLLSISDQAGLALTLSYSTGSTPPSVAPVAGLLIGVSDPFGRSLSYVYNGAKRVTTLTGPAGEQYAFAYDSAGNLSSVTFPGAKVRQYKYNEAAHIADSTAPFSWTRATVTVCHTSNCVPVFNDTAYVAENNPLLACHMASNQMIWFSPNYFGGAEGGPSSGTCYFQTAGQPPTTHTPYGNWAIETGCVSGTYPNQVKTAGSPGCPVSLPNALTGIVDENGIRFATYKYDGLGRVASSEHAGGVEKYTFDYTSPTSTTVGHPLGASRVLALDISHGVVRAAGMTGDACPSCGPASVTRDANGNVDSKLDWNGNRTDYIYDLTRNLETSRTEGLTSGGSTTFETRTITTQWHGTFRAPTGIAEPLRIGTFSYDANGSTCGAKGKLCSKTIQATTDTNGSSAFSATSSGSARTWAYTYNANGSLLTINGPRTDVSDVTTYTYYANNASCSTSGGASAIGCRGQIATISNALSQTTTVSTYNGHGQPLEIVDPNGLSTILTYDPRLRLTSRSVGGETTTYTYDDAGLLTRVTLPDSSYLNYDYDDAHRLIEIADNLGNRIVYTLDATGNRTAENIRDPSNALVQTRSRVYSTLDRLFQEVGAASQTIEYTYDDSGNVLTVKDPLNHATTNQYDALNRLKQATDPASGVTQYGYNGLDALVSVSDPRSNATTYAVNGKGDLTQQVSPDTGTTANTYDAAGNLLTQTDAKSQVTTYTYDALNRIATVTFHDGSSQTYGYDSGAYGLGRLTSIVERNASSTIVAQSAYAYDQRGRLITDTRTINAISYATAYRYDSYGRLDRVTYPSGRTVNYSFDSLGRVSAVTTTPSGGSASNLATSITYHPFGGVTGYTFGNSQTYVRTYDQDGRIASYTLGGSQYLISYDAASRIALLSELAIPANQNGYSYDVLDRLTSASTPTTNYDYAYDAVGNRTSRSAGTSTHTYAIASTSNRVSTITPTSGPVRTFVFDSNGSTTDDGVNTYTYDVKGRMSSATSGLGTTTYQVNAVGHRIRKTNSALDRVFAYDAQGHLIAEHTAAGTFFKEYVWLADSPLAVVDSSGTYFIHIDHLNTPREIYDANQQLRWKWEQQEPFGVNVPDENPSSLGAFEFALRFSGQYFDKETGLAYNWRRDYDSLAGRYIESDPIGLRGGLNTFLYVDGNPLRKIDPTGEGGLLSGVAAAGSVLLVGAGVYMSTREGKKAANGLANWAAKKVAQVCNPPKCNLYDADFLTNFADMYVDIAGGGMQVSYGGIINCHYRCPYSGDTKVKSWPVPSGMQAQFLTKQSVMNWCPPVIDDDL